MIPHLEAEIYYLTEAEGGRKTPVASGYRGQFYYDGKDWDYRLNPATDRFKYEMQPYPKVAFRV